ncbi:hypothetical protein E1262_17630 [Jiangella aurantiaca]|uniref:Uncharacterized protein n=1 Tax=Jiangella aurantiaca TaxID=2530373 RepID=A0A4R5A9M6_9ACTN|nr:hypothetical protein [Jiangella aurantiaca]TDD67836.1 hypothetical protein E1262_17630 [Jiangella aurantiaca]
MSAARSGPFAWSSFGAGYLVASADDAGRPIVDLVLPSSSDGSLHWVAAFGPAEAQLLADRLTALAGVERSVPLAGVRDGVAALEAALRNLADDGDGSGAAADAALGAVDDLLLRLSQLRGELSVVGQPSPGSATATGRAVITGPTRSRAADRRLTTMGGLALALGIVAVFWVALGVLLWALLR